MLAEWIIDYRLDAAALVLLSVAAGLIGHWWLRARHDARLPTVTWCLIAVLTGVACVIGEIGDRWARSRLRRQIEWLPSVYADELRRMGHWKITFDTPGGDPLYLKMIETQVHWLRVNPLIADIYPLRRRPDQKLAFVVDSETDYNHNGKIDEDREQRTPIGEIYEMPCEHMDQALAGKNCFDEKPETDRWGSWVSAYAPLYDEHGNVEAMLGVDYSAESWLGNILWHRAAPLGSACVVNLILASSAAMLTATRREIQRRSQLEQNLRVSEGRLERLSQEDRLTGLPNRRHLQASLAQVVGPIPGQTAVPFALLFIDFDRFKMINDSLGNSAGDELLIEIARRLQDSMAQYEATHESHHGLAARLGGDEFITLIHGSEAPRHALPVVESIQRALAQPYQLKGHTVHGAASIGLTTSAVGHRSADETLRDAGTAMYRAKAAGGGQSAVFDPEMRRQAVQRLGIEMELRSAVERDELVLHYEPIICLETGRVVALEALMRWRHPRRGLVLPSEFIPVAEETGLILPMGLWAIDQAVRQLEVWQERFPSQQPLVMSVNISRKQLAMPGLADQITGIISRSSVVRGTLALEITESTVMEDLDAAANVLARLHSAGAQICLDDFGTGYSSLSCLHSLKIDVLKVDRGFMVDSGTRRDYAAVLHSVVTLAQNLNIKLVAEGVENAEQVALLQGLGCHWGQGYYFAHALPAEAAERFIEQRHSASRSAA